MIKQIQCPGCGLCINECVLQPDAITRTAGGVAIDLEKCIRCGHCVAICPHDRINRVCLLLRISNTKTYLLTLQFLVAIDGGQLYHLSPGDHDLSSPCLQSQSGLQND